MPEWGWEDLNSDSLAPAPKGMAPAPRRAMGLPYSTFGEKARTWNALGHERQPRVCEVSRGPRKKPRSEEKRKEKGGESGVPVPGSRGTSPGAQRRCYPPRRSTLRARSPSPLRNEPGPFTRVPNARFQESHLNTWYLRCKETGSLYLALR